jgi:hypothetical protein
MKPKHEYEIIGCAPIWGDNIPDEATTYCNKCKLLRTDQECIDTIACGERGYVWRKYVV